MIGMKYLNIIWDYGIKVIKEGKPIFNRIDKEKELEYYNKNLKSKEMININ